MIRFRYTEEPVKERAPARHAEREAGLGTWVGRILALATVGLLQHYRQNAVGLAKIQAASYYVQGVGKARKAFIINRPASEAVFSRRTGPRSSAGPVGNELGPPPAIPSRPSGPADAFFSWNDSSFSCTIFSSCGLQKRVNDSFAHITVTPTA